jgi:MoxR-like ATPase
VPGIGKTMLVNTISQVLGLQFARVQFTPDLLPSDIVGTEMIEEHPETGRKQLQFVQGPVFTNMLLADEINRTPPKTQAALLEAMQEGQVTAAGTKHLLDQPFFVLATQNPIEQEGTYPLPEAQVDRFLLKLRIGYPSREEEREIVQRMAMGPVPEADTAVSVEAVLRARELCGKIYVDDKIREYILDIVFATRDPAEAGLSELAPLIRYGASPRASIYLTTTARALAFLRRRGFVIPEDIKELAADVLRHRIILTYEAEAEEITPEDVIRKVLEGIEVP